MCTGFVLLSSRLQDFLRVDLYANNLLGTCIPDFLTADLHATIPITKCSYIYLFNICYSNLPSVVIYSCLTSVLPTMHDHAACLICCAPIILSKASNMQVSMHKLQNMQWLPSVRKCEI